MVPAFRNVAKLVSDVRYFGGSVGDFASASARNPYVVGSTASSDLPLVNGGYLDSPPTGQSDQRSFVAKFDPNGEIVFSDLLGGSTANGASVAINAVGQILVSGTSVSSGHAVTGCAAPIDRLSAV